MNESVGKGAFALILSGFICKIFGLLFRLPLTNIVGIEGIGVFQLIMSIYSLLLVFVSSGVTSSLSKLVSQARARGENIKIGGYLRSSFVFSVSLSALIGIFFALFSKQISLLQGIKQGGNSYLLLILLLPFGSLIGIYRGIFQGYENMNPTAISQIIEQSIKFSCGLLLAYLLKESGNGVVGAFLGITLSEFFALIYLMLVGRKIVKISLKIKTNKEFLSAALPLSFANSIIPLTGAVEALCIIALLAGAGLTTEQAMALYGIQTGVVGTVLHLPLILSLSVSIALLPKISFLSSQNNLAEQKSIISKSFGMLWFFIVPITVGIISVSKVLYPLIYPNLINDYIDVAFKLTLIGGVSTVMNAISQFLVAVLQGKGFFNHSVFYLGLGAILKLLFLFSFAPIPQIGVYAIVLSNIILYSIISLLTLLKLGSIVKVDFFEFFLPILSSAIMFMVVSIILSIFPGVVGLAIGTLSGMIIYFAVSFPLTLEFVKEFWAKVRFQRRNIC